MFDPHRTQYVNRRIQKRAQILRSKNTLTLPTNAITFKDMQKYASILAANKISSYIPPNYAEIPLRIGHVLFSAQSNPPYRLNLAGLKYVEETTSINVSEYDILIIFRVENTDLTITLQSFNGTTPSTTIPSNSYYWIYTQFTSRPMRAQLEDINLNPLLELELESYPDDVGLTVSNYLLTIYK